MPRKTRIYWINVPRDLSKCHSRRCEERAVKDRLCNKHYASWLLADYQPPMPAAYSGTAERATPPLQAELSEQAAVLDDVVHVIASMAVDEPATPAQLEAVLQELHAEKAKVERKLTESTAPLRQAFKRTKRWFEPVEKKLDEAIELANQRLSTARSTIHDLAPRTRTKGGKKKVG